MTDRRPSSASPHHPRGPAGFTLIEVLIVVAIIGILAGIAYPSYGEHVRKTRRSDAHLALLEQRQVLERCRATSYSYVGCSLSATASPQGYYALAFDGTPSAAAFTIVATAQNEQANDTACKKLTIDQRDTTTALDADDTVSTECW